MSRRIVVVLATLVLPLGLAGQARQIPFTDGGWEFQGTHTKVESYHGKTAVRFQSGSAVYRDIAFQDGTIEFDLAVTPYRSFVYLKFRMESDSEYEDLYVRPHKSMAPDAIQYSPVYQGASNWQLYHAAGYTGAAVLPPHQWIHVRVVVGGSRAAVFVGDDDEPEMVIPLAREPRPGYLAVAAGMPAGGGPEGTLVASFANLVVRPGDVSYDLARVPLEAETPEGVVTAWHISPAFRTEAATLRNIPADVTDAAGWKTVHPDPAGLVVLGRHIPVSPGSGRPTVLAKLTIDAERDMTSQFNFGYSDYVSVFLNGRLLFSGDHSYRFNLPRRQGLITVDQASLYLPLQRGSNELVLSIGEVFGGWGVMGRFPDAEGIAISAR
jgi:hypothetical protein